MLLNYVYNFLSICFSHYSAQTQMLWLVPAISPVSEKNRWSKVTAEWMNEWMSVWILSFIIAIQMFEDCHQTPVRFLWWLHLRRVWTIHTHNIYWHMLFIGVWSLSHVRLFETPWTVAHQVPLSTEFSRQEYWSGLSFPPSGDLPDPGIKPASPALAGGFFTTELLGKRV